MFRHNSRTKIGFLKIMSSSLWDVKKHCHQVALYRECLLVNLQTAGHRCWNTGCFVPPTAAQLYLLRVSGTKNYRITATPFKKSSGYFNQIFKVLWCLETPVETSWAVQRVMNHLTHIRHKLKTLLCPYRQARQSFGSGESLRTWLTLTRGRDKHNKPLCLWKQDFPRSTHHDPGS